MPLPPKTSTTFAVNPRTESDRRTLVALALLLTLAGALLTCCTVAPPIVTPTQPSYSGSAQTSGILRLVDGGAIVDAHYRARWKALCAAHANLFEVPPDPEAIRELPDGTLFADNQTLVQFAVMNRVHKGAAP